MEDSFKSDMWSLACFLYFIYYKVDDFSSNNCFEIFKKVEKSEYQFPAGGNEELNQIIKILLKKEASERPSIKELLNHEIIKQKVDKYDLKNIENQKITGLISLYEKQANNHNQIEFLNIDQSVLETQSLGGKIVAIYGTKQENDIVKFFGKNERECKENFVEKYGSYIIIKYNNRIINFQNELIMKHKGSHSLEFYFSKEIDNLNEFLIIA